MKYVNLISNFAEFKELKSIDNSTLIGVLEDVFRHALQKQFESDENFDVIINPEKGDLEIWRNRTVVEDEMLEDENTEIALSEVKAIDASYDVGDEYVDQIDMTMFGRRAVLSLRQNLASRILDYCAVTPDLEVTLLRVDDNIEVLIALELLLECVAEYILQHTNKRRVVNALELLEFSKVADKINVLHF